MAIGAPGYVGSEVDSGGGESAAGISRRCGGGRLHTESRGNRWGTPADRWNSQPIISSRRPPVSSNTSSFTSALSTSFATHPPLVDRIARIENRSSEELGRQIEDSTSAAAPPVSNTTGMHGQAAGFAGAAAAGVAGSGSREVRKADEVRESLSHLGDADADHLAYARVLISSLPDSIRNAVHDTIGAKAVCLLLLG